MKFNLADVAKFEFLREELSSVNDTKQPMWDILVVEPTFSAAFQIMNNAELRNSRIIVKAFRPVKISFAAHIAKI